MVAEGVVVETVAAGAETAAWAALVEEMAESAAAAALVEEMEEAAAAAAVVVGSAEGLVV